MRPGAIAFDHNDPNALMATVVAKLNELAVSVNRLEDQVSKRMEAADCRDAQRAEDINSLKLWRAEVNVKIVVVTLLVSGLGTTIGSIVVALVSRHL